MSISPRIILCILLCTGCTHRPPTATTSVIPAADTPFAPLGFLVGRWEGDESAVFGRGRGHREYRLVLGGTYLLSDNRADYPVQDGLPKGQHHEDWTVFSFDRAAKRFAVRQLNSEGFLNHLVLDPASRVPDELVFVSEHSENAPPGMRLRLTLTRISNDELAEVFEIAMPGGELQPYVRTQWRRVRS